MWMLASLWARQVGSMAQSKQTLPGWVFTSEANRLVRKFGDIALYLDFLAEDPPSVNGARVVDDIIASVIPGVNRALASRRMMTVRGRDLYGVGQRCKVAVADIGPLLVLKLNAFGGPTGRRSPKDAYDVLLAITGFIDGPEAAVVAFRGEKDADNPAYPAAVAVLRSDFSEANQDGPARAAEFFPGDVADRERVRQQVVTVGRILLGR